MEKKVRIESFAKIALAVFIFFVIYFFYTGLFSKPSPGDSLDYHIPIAKSILNGSFLNPVDFPLFKWYWPGSTHNILALFILFHIPLGLFNVLGIVALFLIAYHLGLGYKLEKNIAILFAVSTATLYSIIRMIPSQSIDVWLLFFYLLSLYLLRAPKPTKRYYALLGFALGMLIGSKGTAPFFGLLLILIHIKNFFKYLSISRFLFFLVTFSIFGVFWYARNFYYFQNPVYPQPFIFFRGDWKTDMTAWTTWKTLFLVPHGLKMYVDAFLSEFRIFAFAPLVALIAAFTLGKKEKALSLRNDLVLLGTGNFIIMLGMFSENKYEIIMSIMRYWYVAIVPQMLYLFCVFQKIRRSELFAFLATLNLIVLPPVQYYPKLFLFFIVLACLALRGNMKNIHNILSLQIRKK